MKIHMAVLLTLLAGPMKIHMALPLDPEKQVLCV